MIRLFILSAGLIASLVYFAAAVLPAALLMLYIYRMDKVEKEPPILLLILIGLGIASAIVSGVVESLGDGILSSFVNQQSPVYSVLLAFLVVAAVEEGTKFLFLKGKTWKDPSFNFRFDAIVYAVFVSLGFAAYENMHYVAIYGLSVALPRAFLSIPGHMGFAVFMGMFYGRAKLCERRGDMAGKTRNLIAAYVSAVLMHGIYDACLMVNTTLSLVIFAAFVIVMYIYVIHLIKREANSDTEI